MCEIFAHVELRLTKLSQLLGKCYGNVGCKICQVKQDNHVRIFLFGTLIHSVLGILYVGKMCRWLIHLCIYIMTVEESAKSTYNYLVFTAVFSTPQTCSPVES